MNKYKWIPIKKFGMERQKSVEDHCHVISMRLFMLIITGSIKIVGKIFVAVFTKQSPLMGSRSNSH